MGYYTCTHTHNTRTPLTSIIYFISFCSIFNPNNDTLYCHLIYSIVHHPNHLKWFHSNIYIHSELIQVQWWSCRFKQQQQQHEWTVIAHYMPILVQTSIKLKILHVQLFHSVLVSGSGPMVPNMTQIINRIFVDNRTIEHWTLNAEHWTSPFLRHGMYYVVHLTLWWLLSPLVGPSSRIEQWIHGSLANVRFDSNASDLIHSLFYLL